MSRTVIAATMAGYQDISEFERDFIIGAGEMRYNISHIATFDYSKHVAWSEESPFKLYQAEKHLWYMETTSWNHETCLLVWDRSS